MSTIFKYIEVYLKREENGDKNGSKKGGAKMVVIIDTREHCDVEKFLDMLHVPYEKKALPYGDYDIEGILTVERKTVNDLYMSIVYDNRFAEQLPQFAKEVERPVIAVIGHPDELSKHNIQYNPNVLYGAVASLIVRHGVEVWWLDDDWQFANLLALVHDKIQQGKVCSRKNYRRDPLGMRMYFLSGIRGITPPIAYQILMWFKSIRNFVNAPSEELQKVPGIGPIKAIQIREFLDKPIEIEEVKE